MKRLVRTLLLVGVVAAIVAFVRARRSSDPLPQVGTPDGAAWPPLPDVEKAAPSTVTAPAEDAAADADDEPEADETEAQETGEVDEGADRPWEPPTEAGDCPDGYPLKANVDSGIYHAPGQMSYDRTVPERCYARGEDAEADGFRAAKR